MRRWRFSPFSSFFDERRNDVNPIDRVEDFKIRRKAFAFNLLPAGSQHRTHIQKKNFRARTSICGYVAFVARPRVRNLPSVPGSCNWSKSAAMRMANPLRSPGLIELKETKHLAVTDRGKSQP